MNHSTFTSKLQSKEAVIRRAAEVFNPNQLQEIFVMTGHKEEWERAEHGHTHIQACYYNRKYFQKECYYFYITFSQVKYREDGKQYITFNEDLMNAKTYGAINIRYIFIDYETNDFAIFTKEEILNKGTLLHDRVRKEGFYAICEDKVNFHKYEKPKFDNKINFKYLENTRYSERAYFGTYKAKFLLDGQEQIVEGISIRDLYSKIIKSYKVLDNLKYSTFSYHISKGTEIKIKELGIVITVTGSARVKQQRNSKKVAAMKLEEIQEYLDEMYDKSEEEMSEYIFQVTNLDEIKELLKKDNQLTIAGLYRYLKNKVLGD